MKEFWDIIRGFNLHFFPDAPLVCRVFFLLAESTESKGKFDFLHNYKSAVKLSRFRAVFITSVSHEEFGQGKHSTRITVLVEDD